MLSYLLTVPLSPAWTCTWTCRPEWSLPKRVCLCKPADPSPCSGSEDGNSVLLRNIVTNLRDCTVSQRTRSISCRYSYIYICFIVKIGCILRMRQRVQTDGRRAYCSYAALKTLNRLRNISLKLNVFFLSRLFPTPNFPLRPHCLRRCSDVMWPTE